MRRNSQLREARKDAGFKSARAAAITFSWSESSYAAHESGARGMSKEQEKKYFDAFASLMTSKSSGYRHVSMLTNDEANRRGSPRLTGRRLYIARRLAGFETAKQATTLYRWNAQTYYAHESGRHGISPDFAQLYGGAFGVSPNWLLRGKQPSGLTNDSGRHADLLEELATKFVNSKDKHLPEALLRVARPDRRATQNQGLELRKQSVPKAIAPRAINAAGDVLDVVRERPLSISDGAPPPGKAAWGFPVGFLEQVWKIKSTNLVVFALSTDVQYAGVSAGDRILVDADDIDFRPGPHFAIREGETGVSIMQQRPAGSRLSPMQIVLGRVVAKLVRSAGALDLRRDLGLAAAVS